MTRRRRVANFTDKARTLIGSVDWPEGVKVVVEGASHSDQVFVYAVGGGARTFWSLDPTDLTSAAPAVVRATAIKRLVSAGHDPTYSEKSRAEDLALADLLRGGPCSHPDVPTGTQELVRCPDCWAVLLIAGEE